MSQSKKNAVRLIALATGISLAFTWNFVTAAVGKTITHNAHLLPPSTKSNWWFIGIPAAIGANVEKRDDAHSTFFYADKNTLSQTNDITSFREIDVDVDGKQITEWRDNVIETDCYHHTARATTTTIYRPGRLDPITYSHDKWEYTTPQSLSESELAFGCGLSYISHYRLGGISPLRAALDAVAD
ncbi:MAG: hypothetical protein KGJ05_04985 [Alphaproteobacteria bacterium]|nr:hypothetical protein [Alphaproteobacteria bacterium]MDE2341683.1 hypothetical protein [Alphaproteobacteria bacterium]